MLNNCSRYKILGNLCDLPLKGQRGNFFLNAYLFRGNLQISTAQRVGRE